jgi:cobalt-zinc-cadmium resistance protein CzcA
LVTKAANDKFINGDINYLEWVMLINQNTEIQHIETVRKFNETILKLENLISK